MDKEKQGRQDVSHSPINFRKGTSKLCCMQATFNGQLSGKAGNAVPREVIEDVELGKLTDLPIGQRTRARNPLKEVTIEELEALLLEDEVHHSEGEDDEAYQQFLQVSCCNPLLAFLII